MNNSKSPNPLSSMRSQLSSKGYSIENIVNSGLGSLLLLTNSLFKNLMRSLQKDILEIG